MQYTDDEKALIWLAACSRLDPRESERLLSVAPSAHELFENLEEFMPEAFVRGRREIFAKNKLADRERDLSAELERMEKKGYFAVTRLNEDFPPSLAANEGAPIVLFGAGNRALLKEKMFCIVGSRKTRPAEAEFGMRAAEELSKHFAITTGIAEGGDLAALKGSLKNNRTVCVLPCGLNECYPTSHFTYKEKVIREGLLLSENPCDGRVHKFSFHARNRILAGLATGALILSAGERSGALITANLCADYGRDLFVVPYEINAAVGVGCNKLIKQGAMLCDNVQDILDYYHLSGKENKLLKQFSEQELKILTVLKDGEDLHASVIAQRAEMQIYEATAILAKLEMDGFVVKSGGNCYKIIG